MNCASHVLFYSLVLGFFKGNLVLRRLAVGGRSLCEKSPVSALFIRHSQNWFVGEVPLNDFPVWPPNTVLCVDRPWCPHISSLWFLELAPSQFFRSPPSSRRNHRQARFPSRNSHKKCPVSAASLVASAAALGQPVAGNSCRRWCLMPPEQRLRLSAAAHRYLGSCSPVW